MASQTPQTLNLASLPAAKQLGNIKIQSVSLNGKRAARITVQPGGSWSKDMKAMDGTESCQKSHFGIVLSGKMGVRMEDGTEAEMGKDDLYHVPAGHDAWCVGDEATVFLEFSGEVA